MKIKRSFEKKNVYEFEISQFYEKKSVILNLINTSDLTGIFLTLHYLSIFKIYKRN